MNKKNMKRKNTVKSLLITLLALIIVGAIGVGLASLLFFADQEHQSYASCSVQLLFDGAAKGETPFGNKFSLTSGDASEIIALALDQSGMKEKYTVDDIAANLYIGGAYTKDAVNNLVNGVSVVDYLKDNNQSVPVTSNEFNPTTYNVILYSDFDSKISSNDLEKLLDSILKVYRSQIFEKNSLIYKGIDSIEMVCAYKYDYQQKLDIIRGNLHSLQSWANTMFAQKTTFSSNGLSFQDVSLKCQQLLDYDLQLLDSQVYVNSFTKDPLRMRYQYEFYIEELTRTLDSQNELLSSVNLMIDAYEKDALLYLASGDNITKIESTSDQTYDELVAKRTGINENITQTEARISRYQSILDNLGKSSRIDASKLEIEITALEKKVSDLGNDFGKMLEEYNNLYFNPETISVSKIKYNEPELLSGSFVVMAIKCAGPLCLITLIVILLVSLILEIKMQKKQKKA